MERHHRHDHHDHEVLISVPDHNLHEVEMPKANVGTNVQSKLSEPSSDRGCYFSKHEHDVCDLDQRSKSTTKLWGLMFFYLIVMAVEVVGGLKANSLAVLTDAAHLLTDIGGFSISLFTVWVSGWNSTPHQSFGFSRIEVLGALLSIQLIWVVSGYLIFEAIERILHKQSEVNGALMFPIAAFGFAINFMMVMWLGHGHGHGHDHGHEIACNGGYDSVGWGDDCWIGGMGKTRMVDGGSRLYADLLCFGSMYNITDAQKYICYINGEHTK